MKKIVFLLLAACLLLPLAACSEKEPSGSPSATASPSPVRPSPPEGTALYHAKIIQTENASLLLAGTWESESTARVCSLSAEKLSLSDGQGAALSYTDLVPGMTVEVSYGGEVMETYPCQLSEPTALRVTGKEDDLVGFYLGVLEDLYQADSGLNSELSVMALNLEEEQNLTQSEKAALVWLFAEKHGVEPLTGTFDQLCEEGYIDRENLVFETGLLFTISSTRLADGSFTFDADKWRSGLGAYFFVDCKAAKEDGNWTYTIGSEAIS